MALHSDRGFTSPFDAEHAGGKVLTRVAKSDELDSGTGGYLAQNYTNSEFIVEEGGHISGIYTLNKDVTHFINV